MQGFRKLSTVFFAAVCVVAVYCHTNAQAQSVPSFNKSIDSKAMEIMQDFDKLETEVTQNRQDKLNLTNSIFSLAASILTIFGAYFSDSTGKIPIGSIPYNPAYTFLSLFAMFLLVSIAVGSSLFVRKFRQDRLASNKRTMETVEDIMAQSDCFASPEVQALMKNPRSFTQDLLNNTGLFKTKVAIAPFVSVMLQTARYASDKNVGRKAKIIFALISTLAGVVSAFLFYREDISNDGYVKNVGIENTVFEKDVISSAAAESKLWTAIQIGLATSIQMVYPLIVGTGKSMLGKVPIAYAAPAVGIAYLLYRGVGDLMNISDKNQDHVISRLMKNIVKSFPASVSSMVAFQGLTFFVMRLLSFLGNYKMGTTAATEISLGGNRRFGATLMLTVLPLLYLGMMKFLPALQSKFAQNVENNENSNLSQERVDALLRIEDIINA